MGAELFDQFPDLEAEADRVLGYSIKQLCLADPRNELKQTQFTQPALFTVNAMAYRAEVERSGLMGDFLAGHSLGEYNALHAAGVFDFATGLRLVQHRGALMSQAAGGAMAAVVGLSESAVRDILKQARLDEVDLANDNSPVQTVISGLKADLELAAQAFSGVTDCTFIPLLVSGAFHSRHMAPARRAFSIFLEPIALRPPERPVFSNVEAAPHSTEEIKRLLAMQITSSVRWTESIQAMCRAGVTQFREIGPGEVLQKLVAAIKQRSPAHLIAPTEIVPTATIPKVQASITFAPASPIPTTPAFTTVPEVPIGDAAARAHDVPHALGARAFCKAWNVKRAWLAGGLENGVSGADMVRVLGTSGSCGFLGLPGMSEQGAIDLIELASQACTGLPWGVSLGQMTQPSHWLSRIIRCCLDKQVAYIELRDVLCLSADLVELRYAGTAPDGTPARRMLIKVSSAELARLMLSPPPRSIVQQLLQAGRLTAEEAKWAVRLPIATDLAIDTDFSQSHAFGSAALLLPSVRCLADQAATSLALKSAVAVGVACGAGSPETAATAFMLGANFVMTGYANQSTIQAATSALSKEMLCQAGYDDITPALAADTFELELRSPVLRKSIFFAARGEKLLRLYQQYPSILSLPVHELEQLEQRYFHAPIANILAHALGRWPGAEGSRNSDETDQRHQLASVFRWYLHQGAEWALQGDAAHVLDFRIPCGPEMGAFNTWMHRHEKPRWQDRDVGEINLMLHDDTLEFLVSQAGKWARAA
jgi:trans-AT polyketide synthase/acyltransferase/oxidoreductase domain-containing protein